MKALLKIFIFTWLTLWLTVGVLIFIETPEQIERDRLFIENEIKPSVTFIEDFKQKHYRLPSNREYYSWRREFHEDYTSDMNQPVDSLISPNGCYIRKSENIIVGDVGINNAHLLEGVDWSKEYAIGIWRGEWFEYYFSWNKTYYTNNYNWAKATFSMLFFIGIGLVPLFLWLLFKKKKRGIA